MIIQPKREAGQDIQTTSTLLDRIAEATVIEDDSSPMLSSVPFLSTMAQICTLSYVYHEVYVFNSGGERRS